MNRLILAVVIALAATPALAQVELSPQLSTQNADNVTLYAGQKVYPTGSFHPMGNLYGTTGTTSTATGTAEQTLGTYSLPANALDATGRRLRIRAAFALAANTNNKTMKLYFGSEVITTPTAATNGKNAYLELDVVKTGSSTQIVWGKGLVDTTAVTPYVSTTAAETDTAAITIKATGTDGTSSAGDINLVDFSVEYLN